MKIKVTDLETKKTTIYDYSNNNWAGRYACMKNGLVHMWTPPKLSSVIITSGRKWELING